jgi:ADP-heptose:LPS heptosyltransferase
MGNYGKRIFRLRRWLKIIRFRLSDPVFRFPQNATTGKPTLLLIKTEAIGDYIFFRNFLELIRKHPIFKNYHITVLGNNIWESIALTYDKAFVDEWIFIDRKRFQLDESYRHQWMKEIGSKHYEMAINATFSREFLLGDSIIRSVSATQKIGMLGDAASEIPPVKDLCDRFYDKLVEIPMETTFEFHKNKYFFEVVLNQKIDWASPFFSLVPKAENKVLLMPGAQDKERQWSPQKFQEISYYLHERFGCEVVIAGGSTDHEAAELIIGSSKPEWISNMCGKLSLAELIQEMVESRLAVCNDSGTLHMAAACGIPTIAVSNGNHYGRFTPYPKDCGKQVEVLYPTEFLTGVLSHEERMASMAYGSGYSIQDISSESVIEAIERMLHV